ncbi:MAG TPA: hypothetical protein VFH68_10145 [Polyangia bacterium]|jgi:hypothetical protein|nr:hypothetical protein [Polyangia bacterium]
MGKCWMLAVGWVGVAIAGGGSAWAGGGPLLVIVEAQPGLGVDAAMVRQRIATELGQPVTSLRDPSGAEASDLLLVALGGGEIRISLREGSATRVSRVIPDTPDRSARLRAIAWLAGNLARDQVSAILPLPPPAQAAPPPPALVAADPPPALDRAATEPPRLPPVVDPTTSLPSVAAQRGWNTGRPDARWAVTAAGGLTATQPCLRSNCVGNGVVYESNYALEVQHRTRPDGLAIGGALDAGPTSHLLGLLGFIGSRWEKRGWFAEATLGAGLLAVRIPAATTTVTNSSVTGSLSETTVSTQVQPALYARAVGAIGLSISDDLDLVARLGVHLASSGLVTDFLSATAGVRLKVP